MTFTGTDYGFLLSLEPGDELVRCLIQFARSQEVDAAVVTGIGAVAEVEIAAARGRDRARLRRHITGPLEAYSLTGTLTLVDGEPFPRLQGTFARADRSLIAGHVYQAVCASHIDLAVQLVGRANAGASAATLHVNGNAP